MNQMLQDAPQVQEAPEAKAGAETVDRPPAPAHPRFAKPQRVAFVQSAWHREVVEECRLAFLEESEARHIARAQIDLFEVPGSFEIPLLALKLAGSKKFDAVICLGTIIRGQTPHFEYIAGAVTKGIAQAGMETGVPVVYGIVTADTLEQAIDRAGVKAGNKGFEAAMSAVELVNLYKAVTSDE